MGGCQNCGPFLGTLNIRCHIIIGIQKGNIILTATHMFIHLCTNINGAPRLTGPTINSLNIHSVMPGCRQRTTGSVGGAPHGRHCGGPRIQGTWSSWFSRVAKYVQDCHSFILRCTRAGATCKLQDSTSMLLLMSKDCLQVLLKCSLLEDREWYDLCFALLWAP